MKDKIQELIEKYEKELNHHNTVVKTNINCTHTNGIIFKLKQVIQDLKNLQAINKTNNNEKN